MSLVYMRHRYYDPALRSFISRDPVEDDSLGNLYAGFENNPGNYTDPWGLDTYWIGGAADASPFMGFGPTHIMKYVMEDRQHMFPKDLPNHYYGYEDEDAIYVHIIAERRRQQNGKCTKVKVVNLIGHSLGGAVAMRLTNKLKAANIKVNVLLTLDAVSMVGTWWTNSPDNQRYWGNIYQKQSVADSIATAIPYLGQLIAGGLSALVSNYGDAVATLGGSIGKESGADYNKQKRLKKNPPFTSMSITNSKGEKVTTSQIPDFSHMHAKSFFDRIIKAVPRDIKDRVYE